MRLLASDKVKIDLAFDEGVAKVSLQETERLLATLPVAIPDLGPGQINVLVTSAARVQELNQRHAGKASPTDVLSFDYREATEEPFSPQSMPRTETLPIGEIVVSRDHVSSQAEQAATGEGTELALLVLHGVLHLAGYDHATSAERATLDELQAELMKQAGLNYRDFQWQD